MDARENTESLLVALKRSTAIVDGHWRFVGSHYASGYGRSWFDGEMQGVHRLSAYVLLGFDLTDSLWVLHRNTCPYKDCWNPDCLYIGTAHDNTQDLIKTGTHSGWAGRGSQTSCVKGHEFSPENTYITRLGRRACKACRRECGRKLRQRAKEPLDLAQSAI